MKNTYDKTFWSAAFERAMKSFVQGILTTGIGGPGAGLIEIDWIGALNLSLAYALASLLTSILSAGVSSTNDISLTNAEKVHSNVAAVESLDNVGGYEAAEASPFPEGTPVDVVLDDSPDGDGYRPLDNQ